MTTAINHLWQTLKKADLVADVPAQYVINSPWYVKTLLAVSGWLGGFFLLGFVFLLCLSFIEEPSAALFLSMPLFASAYFILAIPKNEFYEHLALALSLAGQALLLWSLIELQFTPLVWLMFGIIQMVLAYFMASFLHRVFSIVFAALAFEVTLSTFGLPYILSSLLIFPSTWFCLHEFSFVSQYKRTSGLMYGFVIAMLLLNGNHLFGLELMNFISSTSMDSVMLPGWAADLIFISASLYAAKQLISVYDIKLKSALSLTVLLFSLILAIATLKAPGIMVGLIVMFLGFAQSNRVMLGLGVLSLLLYSATYYYMLEETLLFKSVVLFAIAVFMLIGRLLLARFSPLLREELNA